VLRTKQTISGCRHLTKLSHHWEFHPTIEVNVANAILMQSRARSTGFQTHFSDELLPNLKELSRDDKLKVMQYLILELSQEVDKTENPLHMLQADATYPIWSPYECYEAADAMNKMLEEFKQDVNG
jgi:hypothetical protein